MAIILKSLPGKEREGKAVPLIPLRQGIVFPHTEAVLSFGRPKSVAAVETAYKSSRLVCFSSQKDPAINEPGI